MGTQDLANVFILGVEQSPTRTGGTLYKVKLSDGSSPSTFDGALATKAHQASVPVAQAAGQQPPAVTVRLELKPNPRGGAPYKNLIELAYPGETLSAAPVGLPATGIPATAGLPAAAPVGGIPAAAPQGGGGGGRGMSPEDVLRVSRLSCLASATTVVGALFSGAGDVDPGTLAGKTIQLAEAFLQYAFTGQGPAGQVIYPAAQQAQPQQEQGPIIPTASTPQEVVQQVQQAGLPAGVVQVGVPVAQQPQPDQQPQQGPSDTLPAWLGGQ